MKLVKNINEVNEELSKSYIEREGDERVVTSQIIGSPRGTRGELFVPEGIEVIENGAFVDKGYHTYYFPKSLKRIGFNLFEQYNYNTIYPIKIVYSGSSQAFKKLALEKTEEKYETDGFDHYPYYSGNSRWVTHYYSFDDRVACIEVECLEDGVTLLYGTLKNRPNGEEPKIKE